MNEKTNEFVRLVADKFDFLESEFAFVEDGYSETNRDIYAYYYKEQMLVEINWNLPNQFINITMYRFAMKNFLTATSLKNSVSLHHLMRRNNGSFSMEKHYYPNMPKQIGLCGSLEWLSTTLKDIARPILDGRYWMTWEEILKHKK